MELVRSRAVVLRRIRYGDTSLIATLFSEDEGKVSVIAKGALSSKSRRGLAAALEPLNLIEAVFYFKESRSVQTLSAADVLDDAAEAKSSYDGMMAGMRIISAFDRLTQELEPSAELWRILLATRETLKIAEEEKLQIVETMFRAAMLAALGYMPMTDSCAACGRSLSDGAGYSAERGGLLCADCRRGGLKLEASELEYLRSAFAIPGEFFGPDIPASIAGKIARIVESHGDYYVHRWPRRE